LISALVEQDRTRKEGIMLIVLLACVDSERFQWKKMTSPKEGYECFQYEQGSATWGACFPIEPCVQSESLPDSKLLVEMEVDSICLMEGG
jgi:hypothetical protein